MASVDRKNKIAKLQKISDEVRIDLEKKYLDYYGDLGNGEKNEYSADHKDAMHNEADKTDMRGKGAGGTGRLYLPISDEYDYKTGASRYKPTVNTETGGGAYDIDGNPAFFGGENGRNWAKRINLYGPDGTGEYGEYGRNLIDTESFRYYYNTSSWPRTSNKYN